jgi:hypothetical protein
VQQLAQLSDYRIIRRQKSEQGGGGIKPPDDHDDQGFEHQLISILGRAGRVAAAWVAAATELCQ